MARQSTGSVKWRYSPELQRECWCGRFTRADGTKSPWVALDETIAQDDEPGARAAAASLAPHAKATTADGKGETLDAYSERWLAARPAKTARANRSHLREHILRAIGHVSILGLTHAHGDQLVAYLDKKIAAGTMTDKTARNVWGTAKKMIKDAATAKPATGLRCLDADPFRDVQPPDKTKTKQQKQFLYPSELLALVMHRRVPLWWKWNVVIACYLGLRSSEQRALRWLHVDLEHHVVRVVETYDRETQTVRDGTKTGTARTVAIPRTLMPLLRVMHERAGGNGLVCRMPSERAMARGIRTWLRVAGVTRESLFKTTSVNLNVRYHDCRATCGTWLAVQGKTAPEIRDALGHAQLSMTDRYLRDASTVRGGGFGEPFPELPAFGHFSDLSEGGDVQPSESTAKVGGVDGTRIRPPGASKPPVSPPARNERDHGTRTRFEPFRDPSAPADTAKEAVSECPNPPALGHAGEPTIDELRAALGAAIRDRAWRAVEIVQAQIDDRERAGVVDLAAERERRHRDGR